MPQPNILVIMADQMKATASHLYGNTFCQTPSIARLASQGVQFRHAFTPHPLCVPARVALWTGQYAHSTGARRNETLMPPRANHAFRIWKEMGYATGLIGKNHCFREADDLALFDTWCDISHVGLPRNEQTRGMDWFRPIDGINAAHAVRRAMPNQSPRFSYAATDFPLEDYSSGLIAGQTVRYLEQHRNEPFALWVSFPDPHEPYEAPRRYFDMFSRDRIELPPWREGEFGADSPERNRILHEMMGMEEDSIDDVYGVMAAYYGMVRFMDDSVGQILDALDRLDLRRETIVVFCSDHGDFAGEHRMTCKGGVFYDCLTRVPLIVSWPGQVAEGCVDDSMASLIDIVPTILSLQGQSVPLAMQGQPLPNVTVSAPRDAAFSEYGAGGPAFHMKDLAQLQKPYGRRALGASLWWREAEGRRKMARTREWKYVHDPMGDMDELYNLVNDPWELENVAGHPDCAQPLAMMRLRLADWSIQTEDAQSVPLPPPGFLPMVLK